ncbi:tetratricopeptide repeat-containing sulfotransferase family protein [Congregibacter litoralis]|uniref:Sulfotransferase family n=1 Tax=Congregibacter litoralis KT71 TaxID=314285 RepID=A4ABW3_9GAMM|nr:sulfotransferase [Congregibacter litoralis]EAQ96413.1 Sulfotransferase family [Congregibacter litoralis KT71]
MNTTSQSEASLQDLLNEGSQFIEARQLEDADAVAQELLRRFPEQLEVRYLASDVESLRGDAIAALRHLDALPEDLADSPRILLRKAQLCLFAGQSQRALNCARAVDLLEAKEPELAALSQTFTELGQLKEARNCLLIARDKNPDSQQLLYLLAVSEAQLDLTDESEKHLAQVLEKSPTDPGALHLRSQLRRWSENNNHIQALRNIIRKSTEPLLTAIACYAMAKEFEDLGDYKESFAAYDAGAQTYRKLVNYDEAVELGAQEDIRDTFDASRLASLTRGAEEPGPIFVLGMPRTGLRLVERVLAKHSAITPGGELGHFRRFLGVLAKDAAPAEVSDAEATLAVDFAELGRRYSMAARERVGDGPRFVDCTSFNFLYCGHILTALPGAKIIHMHRDPLDTLYSAYKTLVFGAHSYSYNLDELVNYYLSYRAQMEHWHSLFPGSILDVRYEELVTDSEGSTRRMLDFCDLAFEEGMLDPDVASINTLLSASKVLPPLHRDSLGVAARGGARFDDLRQRLKSAGGEVSD